MRLVVADLLIDGTGAPPLAHGAVLVDGERIHAVGPAAELRRAHGGRIEAEDALRGTLLPGLIDVHTHLCLSADPDPAATAARESRARTAARGVMWLRRALDHGVTTVRDLGGVGGIDTELARAVEDGLVPGPRVFASGHALCITGGHGWFIGREVDGADEARKAAREQFKQGARWLKLIATGGVVTKGVEPGTPQLQLDEMSAAVAEARRSGRRAAAHAQGTEGIKDALRAGVHSIEHGFFMDGEAVEMMRERGAFLVPTFMASKGILEGDAPGWQKEKLRRVGEAHERSFRSAVAGGVKVATGTDAGTPGNPWGGVAGEAAEFVRRGGLTPMQAVQAATAWAAELLGLDDCGVLAAGRRADLVAVEGNPAEEIAALARVRYVMEGGAEWLRVG